MNDRQRLSPAGERRRRAMLAELQTELARARRSRERRQIAGGIAAGLVACVAFGAALHVVHRAVPHEGPPSPVAQRGEPIAPDPLPSGPRPEPARISVAIVRTDPAATARYETHAPLDSITLLSDEQLLHDLREAGYDCGLVKMAGRAWLTCAFETPVPPFDGG